jgi:hypothetical protein
MQTGEDVPRQKRRVLHVVKSYLWQLLSCWPPSVSDFPPLTHQGGST